MNRLAILCAAAFLLAPSLSQAKAQRTVAHSFTQVWPTVIRHLRVDEGFKIVEKDSEAGYVVFELSEEKRKFKGALELVRVVDSDKRPHIRLVMRIGERPVYSEQGVLDRMVEKLREEYGDPPPPPSKKKTDDATEESRLHI